MASAKGAFLVLALIVVNIFLVVIALSDLVSGAIPVNVSKNGSPKAIPGYLFTYGTLNAVAGLLIVAIILAFAQLLLFGKLWRDVRKERSQTPASEIGVLFKRISNHIPTSVRLVVFSVLLLSLFAPVVIYPILAYFLTTNNPSFSYLLDLAEYSAFFFIFADGLWRAQPDSRFSAFRTGRSRHKTWLQVNQIFHDLATLEFIEIVIILEVDALEYIHHPSPNGDPFILAALLSFVYFFSMVIRNSVCNLVGQGYGGLIPSSSGKIAGTSLIGVASLADLARSLFLRAEQRGKSYLRTSIDILRDTLEIRRIKLAGLDQLSGALAVTGEFGTALPYEALADLAGNFAALSLPLNSLQEFSSLTVGILNFSRTTKWPNALQVVPVTKRKGSEYAVLAATILAGVGPVIAVLLSLFHVSLPESVVLREPQTLFDAASTIVVVVMIWLSYGPFSRLQESSVTFRDLRRF